MKYVYKLSEGNKDMKEILGSKGANLSEMVNLGVNVPPGFVITTDACREYLLNNDELDNEVVEQIISNIKNIELVTDKSFGTEGKTLLFSVRSGAPVSMPGMMDSILNIGLNDTTVLQFAAEINDDRVAYDCYRRLISMYGNVVKNISSKYFENALTNIKKSESVEFDYQLTSNDFKNLVLLYKQIYFDNTGEEFPQNVGTQLLSSIEAVFKSWNNERAITYRKINKVSDRLCTGVVVQMMVFGNYNENSCTGVMFSSNPNNGEKELFGEYLLNAQGEDIVAGVRTPYNMEQMKIELPEIYDELFKTATFLENQYKDMQDIEFTVENGKLYILQTRSAQRSNNAKVKFLLDSYELGHITKEDFVDKITVEDVESYLFSKFDEKYIESERIFANGLPASPGAETGVICFDEETVLDAKKRGINAILIRNETSADDIASMNLSDAIVTRLGGMTSHAAVVARGMGKCCVCGVSKLNINEKTKTVECNGILLREGDIISVDGNNGAVYIGEIQVVNAKLDNNFIQMMKIIESVAEIKVYANADEGNTCYESVKYGAQGIGLVRTEHMFFEEDRLIEMQGLIMCETLNDRIEYLKRMSVFQIDDFKKILEVMDGKEVSIRLLDPPLHEFLPKKLSQAKELSSKLNINIDKIKDRIKQLKEENPMLGHRGCRLGVSYPEIYQMQVESIVSAVVALRNKGLNPKAKIMVPLVSEENELVYLKKIIDTTITRLLNGQDIDINIEFGVMIETPRAALISDRLASHVDFFSYGTNDLTQMTYGFSRDDVVKFMPTYIEKKVLKNDPFVTIDKLGVGKLIIISNQFGKVANPDLVTGICGEHGGEFDSVQFAYNIGLDYVSCSPKRIPVAKLAAAKAVLEVGNVNEQI